MANRHYDENGVVRMLSKNPFVTVDTVNKSITWKDRLSCKLSSVSRP